MDFEGIVIDESAEVSQVAVMRLQITLLFLNNGDLIRLCAPNDLKGRCRFSLVVHGARHANGISPLSRKHDNEHKAPGADAPAESARVHSGAGIRTEQGRRRIEKG